MGSGCGGARRSGRVPPSRDSAGSGIPLAGLAARGEQSAGCDARWPGAPGARARPPRGGGHDCPCGARAGARPRRSRNPRCRTRRRARHSRRDMGNHAGCEGESRVHLIAAARRNVGGGEIAPAEPGRGRHVVRGRRASRARRAEGAWRALGAALFRGRSPGNSSKRELTTWTCIKDSSFRSGEKWRGGDGWRRVEATGTRRPVAWWGASPPMRRANISRYARGQTVAARSAERGRARAQKGHGQPMPVARD